MKRESEKGTRDWTEAAAAEGESKQQNAKDKNAIETFNMPRICISQADVHAAHNKKKTKIRHLHPPPSEIVVN